VAPEPSKSSGAVALWTVPECAVSIEYPPALLDDIRLAVLEAFYAFPHGGAEVGGVLFGGYDDGRVRLAAFVPVDCEHAFGPSFTLSDKDRARMGEALRAPARETALEGLRPVGWYHSHTRSGIFLSGQDLEVHERYFPLPWQVALVLRPSSTGTRAGFFVRDATGRMRLDGSYREITLEPLSGRVLARPGAVPPPAPAPEPAAAPAPPPPAPAAPPPAAAHQTLQAAPQPRPVEPPAFLSLAPRRRTRIWPAVAGACLLATAAAAFATRGYWLNVASPTLGLPREAPAPRSEDVTLTATDHGGQLLVRWNQRAPDVTQARAAALEIADGTAQTMIVLAPDQLRSGTFTYVRQTERVDVRLNLDQPDGRRASETTSFLGKPPAPAAPASAAESELLRQREELQAQLQEARTQLVNQTLLIQKLQRMIRDLQAARTTPAGSAPVPVPEQAPAQPGPPR